MNTDTSDNVEQLNSFLRGELGAVETYGECIDRVDDATVNAQLKVFRDSHETRAQLLKNRVAEMGAVPAESSGMWGSVSKLAGGGAALLGTKAAVTALTEGEEIRKKHYVCDLNQLNDDNRFFIEHEILPEQTRTEAAINRIKKTLA